MAKSFTHFPPAVRLVPIALTAFFVLSSALPGLAQTKKAAKKPPAKTSTAKMGFALWKEPKEGAFTVEVPKGWKVEGGILHVGNTEVRRAIEVSAPDDSMTVVVGDFGLPMFSNPTITDQQMGRPEGFSQMINGNFQTILLHYMPALEFNRWYLQNRLGELVENVQIIEEKPISDLSKQLSRLENADAKKTFAGLNAEVTVGVSKWTGRLKETGKPVSGLVLTKVRHLFVSGTDLGNSWWAEPALVACVNNNNTAANVAKVQAAYLHIMQTWKTNPAWAAKQRKKSSDATAAVIRAKGRSMASPSPMRASGSVLSDESHHRFINYICDEHDVLDPTTGKTHTVPDF